jgi:hypothetical protein
MRRALTDHDLRLLATCPECSGTGYVPDITGDYVLCEACLVLPRDPFERS